MKSVGTINLFLVRKYLFFESGHSQHWQWSVPNYRNFLPFDRIMQCEQFFPASIESVVMVDDRNGTGSSNVSRPEINVVENIRSVLRCIVRGGYPPPKIEVFLNERDLTTDFYVQAWANVNGTQGLRVISHRSEAVNSAFVVQATDHLASLRCVASVPGMKRVIAQTRINVSCKWTTNDIRSLMLRTPLLRLRTLSSVHLFQLTLVS